MKNNYNMYLILIKYFYYFYYLKKNKKFKFFILLDLIFFLMKKYFSILIIKKKLLKYKNSFHRQLIQLDNSHVNLNKKIYMLKEFYLIESFENIITKKIEQFNSFLISFLPTQLLPLGNRKKFYNLLNKKFKRFFILIKKKLNRKFFFFYLVQLFRKLKFLFIKSDPFLNKKNFLFEFFSTLSLESNYSSLLQYYKQHNKKQNAYKNKFLSFFNLISFFIKRVDFFLFKYLSFFSLSTIRTYIFNNGLLVNNKNIQTIHYFLNKYDLLIIPSIFYISMKRLYVFFLKTHFSFINNYIYKTSNDIKKSYYIELFKIIKSNKFERTMYITKLNSKKIEKDHRLNYCDLMDNIFSFFFTKHNNEYTFDRLNYYKGNYKIEFQFPFFLKQKKKDLFFNNKPCYLNNISYIYKNSSQSKQSNVLDTLNLNNFTFLYFFLFKYKIFYYYTYNNKMLISPKLIKHMIAEQKKLFYYFTLVYNINFLKLI